MSEVVERVARALHAGVGTSIWEELSPEWQEVYRASARAAIEAMREPTAAMVEAGAESFEWDSSDVNGSWYIAGADAHDCWRAMIDAALLPPHDPLESGKPEDAG